MHAVAGLAMPPSSTNAMHAHMLRSTRPAMSSRLYLSSTSSSSDDDDDERDSSDESSSFGSLRLTAPALANSAPQRARERPERQQQVATAGAASTSNVSTSSPSSSSSAHSHKHALEEDDEHTTVGPLPSMVSKPKGLAERKQTTSAPLFQRASSSSSSIGSQSDNKNKSMAANVARKRANSLKWSKYNNLGAVTIELDLSNDELRRV
ncbi:hypothetical protein OIO90_006532 [Microbotryomycetes sp. JL221]|nr:hypothetical protein OIO90_006532 [Microbotryomycetes sp. JL221]